MKTLTTLTTILIITLFSCKTTNHAQSHSEAVLQIAKQRFGETVQLAASPDNTYALCYQEVKGTAREPHNTIKFFVYDNEQEKVVYEDTVSPGTVQWYDNSRLEIFYLPGVMPANKSREDFTYIYNVETGEKVVKSSLE